MSNPSLVLCTFPSLGFLFSYLISGEVGDLTIESGFVMGGGEDTSETSVDCPESVEHLDVVNEA